MKKYIPFLFFLLSKMTFACECQPINPISKDLFKNYDAIFTGRVDSVSACLEDGKSTAYFFINELYKGNLKQHLEVVFDCSSECLMSFSKDDEWLMYTTYSRFDMLVVNLCGHSRKFFKDASQDYYQMAAERSFEEEKQFLKSSLGVHSFVQNDELSQQQNISRNEQPSGINKLWLLLISCATMVIVYLVTRNKNKKNDK
ncbi:MAG: hypothetical protein V4511_04675 [Bacteroidota bacterium]